MKHNKASSSARVNNNIKVVLGEKKHKKKRRSKRRTEEEKQQRQHQPIVINNVISPPQAPRGIEYSDARINHKTHQPQPQPQPQPPQPARVVQVQNSAKDKPKKGLIASTIDFFTPKKASPLPKTEQEVREIEQSPKVKKGYFPFGLGKPKSPPRTPQANPTNLFQGAAGIGGGGAAVASVDHQLTRLEQSLGRKPTKQELIDIAVRSGATSLKDSERIYNASGTFKKTATIPMIYNEIRKASDQIDPELFAHQIGYYRGILTPQPQPPVGDGNDSDDSKEEED